MRYTDLLPWHSYFPIVSFPQFFNMTEPFKTYYLVDGIKVGSHRTMQKFVLAGGTAIEVSAKSQQVAADKRKAKARADAVLDEKIRRAAAEREHATSAEGQQQAAIRTALANPGGIVSGGPNPFAELEAFLPHKTSLLR